MARETTKGSAGAALRARKQAVGKPATVSAAAATARVPIVGIPVVDLKMRLTELERQNEELRQALLQLTTSRDRFSELYEFAPVSYLSLDRIGVIRESNLAAAELLGLPRTELVGKRFSTFIAREDQDAFHLHLRNALTSDRRSRCELAMRKPDHAPLRLRLESSVIGAQTPESAMLHAALIDITQAAMDQTRLRDLNQGLAQAIAERTEALSTSLALLRSNEERLRLALEAGSMGTWTIDIATGQASCDEPHGQLYGRAPVATVHTFDDWLACLHPDDHDRMREAVVRALQGLDKRLSAEYRILWADGSVHWLMAHGQIFFDEHGRVLGIAGVEQNIDERKGLELEILHIADNEQRRIGQELHDDIQQRLTGLGLMAESLCERLAVKPGSEHAMSSRLARGVSETCERVHRLSHGLVPLDLNGEGLSVALARLARATDAPGRLRCEFLGAAGLEVHDGFAATHLYRIAQEAVTNAIRHSGANRITLTLSHAGPLTTLIVADNGHGVVGRESEGRGMRIMAYRASLIGATLTVTRAQASGLMVRCAVALLPGGVNNLESPGMNEDVRLG